MTPPLPRPTTGPSVWTGPDYAGRDDWIFQLSPAHLAEIDSALRRIPTAVPALYDVTAARFPLPTFAPELAKLADELERGRGFVLIRGLPAGRYDDARLAAAFWGIGAHLGTGLAQSAKGDRLGHVVDRSGPGVDRRQMRNYELGGDLRMHTDLNNDVVGLVMLRAARSGGESRIASSMAVHNIILAERPEYLVPLYRGYHFHLLRTDRADGPPLTAHRVPVFSVYDGALSCHFNPSPIDRAVERAGVKLTEVEAGAIRFFVEVAARPGVYLDMAMMPGDIQFLNNHVVLHGRTDYEDWSEPERRRHLMRLWLRCPNARKQAPETNVYRGDTPGFDNGATR